MASVTTDSLIHPRAQMRMASRPLVSPRSLMASDFLLRRSAIEGLRTPCSVGSNPVRAAAAPPSAAADSRGFRLRRGVSVQRPLSATTDDGLAGGAPNPTTWHTSLRDDVSGSLGLAEPLKGFHQQSRRRRARLNARVSARPEQQSAPAARPSSAPPGSSGAGSARVAGGSVIMIKPAADQPVGLLCRCHAASLSAASAMPAAVAAADAAAARASSPPWRVDGRLSPTARDAAFRKAQAASLATTSIATYFGSDSRRFLPGASEPSRALHERALQRRREMREHQQSSTMQWARQNRAEAAQAAARATRENREVEYGM